MATQLTTNQKSLFPDQSFLIADVLPDALIQQIGTRAGNIEGDAPVVRVPYVGIDPTADFYAEAKEIEESNPELDEITFGTHKVGLISRMSNEAARYSTAQELVANSMSRAVTIKADNAFLNNPVPTGTNTVPAGLLNIAGRVKAGAVEGNLDAINDGITEIEANGGHASAIVIDPRSWGVISKLKTATGANVPLLGSPATTTARTLFGLPVFTSAQMTVGNGLIVDNENLLTAAGEVNLATSDQTYFSTDELAYRVTVRIGWAVVHADRLASFTVPAAVPTP